MYQGKKNLARTRIIQINKDLINYYNHPLGGEYVTGLFLATLYEKKHNIFDHGYDDHKWYKLNVSMSPRGLYVLIDECENPNLIKQNY